MIYEEVKLANKFLPTIVVEISNARNTVAFKTPRVLKKPPLLIFREQPLYQLSRQLNHLATSFSAGIAVADSSARSRSSNGTESILPSASL